MKLSHRRFAGFALVLAALVLLATAAFAAEPARKGVDFWMTVAGFAKTSFADEPIPAGFFCADSQPFTGVIAFKGVPLATSPARSIGSVDTVVRRLDDAVFNDKGEATTRIQLVALSLASTQPIETSCGKYNASVNLAPGEQPVTTMKIFRSEAMGGTYSAPLALNVKVVFTPVSGNLTARRELTRRIDLGPANHSVWAYVSKPRYAEGVMIDTDGDGKPDTLLPKASNFQAGVQPAVLNGQQANIQRAQFDMQVSNCMMYFDQPSDFSCPTGQCVYQSCHCSQTSTDPHEPAGSCANDHLHCIWTCVNP